MFSLRNAAKVAACALLGCAGLARAEDSYHPLTPATATSAGYSLQPKYLGDESAAATRSPLLQALDRVGVGKVLSQYGINVQAFIEGSYTLTSRNNRADIIPGRTFDYEDDTIFLNQLDLAFERKIDDDLKAHRFGIGGKVEIMYGSDAGGIHSNGLLNGYRRERIQGDSENSPTNQFDVTQAYLTFALPIGTGVTVMAGKFVSPFGAEYINPTQNQLFSHSYAFGYAIPFTHTGATAAYNFTDKIAVTAGFTRGWEQSLDDSNGAIDFLGQVAYKYSDQYNLALNLITGPEKARNSRDYRTLVEALLTVTPKDSKFSYTFDGNFAWEQRDGESRDAYWYGVAGYAGYKINEYLTANARLEWFRDEQGVRGIGNRGNFYEATLGVSIHPFLSSYLAKVPGKDYFGSLLIRPEVRYDYAQNGVFGGNGDKHDLFTFGVDAILAY